MQAEATTIIARHAVQWTADQYPLVIGICGAQGSGKSTAAARLAQSLEADGLVTATLSLDDLYLPRDERRKLARNRHPLFETRGVPGTHDTALGIEILDGLIEGRPMRLPRFDKGTDDRFAPDLWDSAPPNVDVILFEGWCVGARPQAGRALATPVNALERERDPEGKWRRIVNRRLATDYQDLFARLNRLVLMAARGFEVVQRWRTQQERPLQQQGKGLSDAQIADFVQYYERLTRHILADMPRYADLTLALNPDRKVIAEMHGRK